MIRRNHTQAVPKTNFADCSLRPRQPYEDTSQAKRQTCKLELQSARDETNRLTSNKKYHQYKNWKEDHHKSVGVWRDEEYPAAKTKVAAKQNVQPQQDQTKLNRQYAYDVDQPLRIDYNSIKISKPSRTVAEPANFNMKTFKPCIGEDKQNDNRVRVAKSGKISHNVSIDNLVSEESPGRKNSYQSSQKYNQSTMAYKQAKPLPFFESAHISIDKKCFPQQSSGKVQNSNLNAFERSYNLSSWEDTIKNGQFRSRQKQPNSTSFVHNTSVNRHAGQGKTEVSDKLKMISEFNDQINERIKKIIVCFEGLKQKL